MSFWRGLFARDRAKPPRPRAIRAPAREGGSAPAMRFLDGEGAERPLDLSGQLDAEVTRGELASQVEEILRLQLEDSAEEAERPFLDALARELRGPRLPLPPMPQSILRVQRLVGSPHCNTAELAREIELDPALSTKLVGIANSPFYAGMEPVHGVRDAVVRIGLGETSNIAMAIALRSKVFRARGYERETAALWRHCLAASVTGRALAAELSLDPDQGFLAGLAHDLGRVVLFTLAGEIRARTRGQLRPAPAAFERLSAAIHAPLGALVAESWRFLPALVQALVHHHAPEGAPPEGRALAGVLFAADALAKRIDGSVELGSPSEEELARAFTGCGLEPDAWRALEPEAAQAFESLSKSL